MDPLAENYYSISPYAYVANNPIRFIDPDGMRIRVAGSNRSQTYQDIAIIYGTPLGRWIISQLHESNQVYTIRNSRTPGGSRYRSRNRSIRYYQGEFVDREGIKYRSFESLGHELYHAYQDFDSGVIGRSRKELERGAVRFENYLRKVYQEGAGFQRLKYEGQNLFKIGEATHFETGGIVRNVDSVNSYVNFSYEYQENNNEDPSAAKKDKTTVNNLHIFFERIFEYMNENDVQVIIIDF